VRLAHPTRSRAVLIGTGRYRSADIADLPAVHNNLADLAVVLTDPRLGGLDRAGCTILADPPLTDAYHVLRNEARNCEDTLIVYFAGHGFAGERNELYLGVAETNPDGLAVSALRAATLRDLLLQSPAANKVVILDCCFAGRAFADHMTAAADLVLGQLEVEGTYFLGSTPANELATAAPGARYTAFTGELLSLLRDGVPQGPELLTLGHLFPLLHRALRRRGLPLPDQRNTGTISQLALSRNAVWQPPAEPAAAVDDTGKPAEIVSAEEAAVKPSNAAAWAAYVPALEGIDSEVALHTRLASLRSKAGSPSYAKLTAAADLVGVKLSRSTVSNLLIGKLQPRWETVSAFVVACKYHAATSRPPMPLPAEVVDLVRWRTWYDGWAQSVFHCPAIRGQTVPPGDIHSVMEQAMHRFEDDPRLGGGYQFLLTSDFAATARMGKAKLTELSDRERAFLLMSTLFLGMGDGFGLYEFLPEPSAPWAANSCTPLLASRTYRTGRYRAAIVLQYLTFEQRDETTRNALSQSSLSTWPELLQAIRELTVSRFLDDPDLCYDYGPGEAHKRRALISTDAGIKEIYRHEPADRAQLTLQTVRERPHLPTAP